MKSQNGIYHSVYFLGVADQIFNYVWDYVQYEILCSIIILYYDYVQYVLYETSSILHPSVYYKTFL